VWKCLSYQGKKARQEGIEPPTHGLEGRCSLQLSYWRTRGKSATYAPSIDPASPARGGPVTVPVRAARFAKILGYAPERVVALALQAQVREAGLKLNVTVEAA
jgi:hypothetical protein